MKLKLLGIVFLGCVFTGNLLSSDQSAQEQKCFDYYVIAINKLKKTIDAAYAKYQLVYSQSAYTKAKQALSEDSHKAMMKRLEVFNKTMNKLPKDSIAEKNQLQKDYIATQNKFEKDYIAAKRKLQTDYKTVSRRQFAKLFYQEVEKDYQVCLKSYTPSQLPGDWSCEGPDDICIEPLEKFKSK